jgi:MFS superfamily sulfate permease-like transporter
MPSYDWIVRATLALGALTMALIIAPFMIAWYPRRSQPHLICTACGSLSHARPEEGLALAVIIALFLGLTILPQGLTSAFATASLLLLVFGVYLGRTPRCTFCRQRRLVPTDSPIGAELLRDYPHDKEEGEPASPR